MSETGAWHPDPYGEAAWRLHDGSAWTGHTAPHRETPDLQPLSITFGKSVKLEQGKGTDVVKCDDLAVGLMHPPTMTGDGTVETSTGAWVLDREGILRGAARVIVQPSNQEIALFQWDSASGTDGTLQFPDGRWFRLTRANNLAQEGVASPAAYDPNHRIWVWYDHTRTPVATVRLAQRLQTKKIFGKEITYTSSSTGKTGDDVWTDMHAAAANTRELGLLTMLGTFVIWSHTLQVESIRRDRNRF
jgi:hypothetical protein